MSLAVLDILLASALDRSSGSEGRATFFGGVMSTRLISRAFPNVGRTKPSYDIVIVVPKDDEFSAVEWALRADFGASTGHTSGKKLYYEHRLGKFTVAVITINDQGNSAASGVTEQVLSELDPTIVFLTGTAAGKEKRVEIGNVIVSSMIVDAQEWRIAESATPRVAQHRAPDFIMADVKRFIAKKFDAKELQRELRNVPDRYRSDAVTNLVDREPKVEVEVIASSNYLHLDPDFLNKLWEYDDRIRCVDMESGGFGGTCKTREDKQWLVVRGISDFGTPESKQEGYRFVTAAAAGVFLRMFIERGLVESLPRTLLAPESPRRELSSTNFYTQFDIMRVLRERLSTTLGVDLEDLDLGRDISLADLEAVCIGQVGDGIPRDEIRKVLFAIREEYFTEKYLDYSYDNDLRGLIPNWAEDFYQVVEAWRLPLSEMTVLDVGVGNGLEIPELFTDAGRLVGADVSNAMLEKARQVWEQLETVHNPAEDLCDVGTATIDLYTSLRTYQSRLFDVPLALREAQRVLKRQGVLILSIANGYVERIDGRPTLVRGLLVPGSKESKRIVDRSRPRRLAVEIADYLETLGFEHVGFKSETTDVYVWGIKP